MMNRTIQKLVDDEITNKKNETIKQEHDYKVELDNRNKSSQLLIDKLIYFIKHIEYYYSTFNFGTFTIASPMYPGTQYELSDIGWTNQTFMQKILGTGNFVDYYINDAVKEFITEINADNNNIKTSIVTKKDHVSKIRISVDTNDKCAHINIL